MSKSLTALALAATLLTAPAVADEGMWLYSQPPLKQMKERYAFTPSPAWLEHFQKASLRFSNGGSGSFVSADGLVMTNHHVAADSVQKLSSTSGDFIKTGFYAPTRERELKCPELELNLLESTEDVTARVEAATASVKDPTEIEKKRRAAVNEIESQSEKATGLKSEVVVLYRGGAYHLYRYRRFDDVRLVFAPELETAFFGGDPDNFEYPRYCLDVSFFRVYQDGKPYRPQHFLKWSKQGVGEGDLVLVSGHPGKTDRLDTYRHLQFLRDHLYPFMLDSLRRREISLNTFAERSLDNAREAQEDRFSVQNSRKARLGGLQGLQDPQIMAAKLTQEKALRKAVAAKPELQKRYGRGWADVERAVAELDRQYERYFLIEQRRGLDSRFYEIARDLVRYSAERAKPNSERLSEFAESQWASLELELFSPAAISASLDSEKFADSLTFLTERLGAADPTVVAVLNGKSPHERAYSLVSQTRLADVSYRKKLAKMTLAQLRGESDPMIQLALRLDPEARDLRRHYADKVSSPLQEAYAKVARAQLATGREDLYPDATFTLRLSYGKVSGYREEGRQIPAMTTLKGLFETSTSHRNAAPYALPESWRKAQGLALETPFNFVCTADIVGGNSGSPVVNRDGEVVGLIFDGNLPSLILDFLYSEEQARALCVDSRAITEALRHVYAASGLLRELTGD